jgi:uncharacterized protein YdhG (YjbR/CyaY superfamily)
MRAAMAVKKPAKKTAASKKLTAEETQAMKDYLREKKGSGESDLRAKISAMPQPDRGMAERLHALVMETAPALTPRTYYGMPAYAKDDKVVCFFQNAAKFKTRYSTFAFTDKAKLDEGSMWATGFALMELTAAEEKRIAALVKKAVG